MDNQTIYSDLSDFNYHYNENLLIQPQKMEFNTKGFGELNINNITIQNIHDNEKIIIYNTYTKSSDIFIHTNGEVTLNPFEETNITFSVYPHKKGRFTALLYIETSIGTIPYTVDYFVERTSPVQLPKRHFYLSTKVENNITLRLDTPPGATVMFDTNVFNSAKAEFNAVYTFLPIITRKPGLVVTFITIYNEDSASYYPLFLHLFDDYLIPQQEMILSKYNSKERNRNEYDIYVYNPTNVTIVVNSLGIIEADRLRQIKKVDPRNNLKLFFSQHKSIKVFPGDTISVGWLRITKQFHGITSDDIVISYTVKKYGYSGEIRIPIIVNGFDSLLNIYTKTPPYAHLDQEGLKYIVIQNPGKIKQVVTSISVLSKYYKIVDFEPFVLAGGEYSKPLTLMLTNEKGRYGPLEVVFATNGTEVKIPFRRKSSGVKIGFPDVKDYSANESILIKESSIFSNCWKDYSIKIFNFNQYPFVIDHVFTTSGVSIKYRRENKNTTISPGQKAWIDLSVKFLPSPPIRRNDTIVFAGNGVNVSIGIEWTPKEGGMYFTSDFSNVLTFGREYTGLITAHSFAKEDIEFTDIRTDFPANISLYKNIILGPTKHKTMAKMYISLDNTFSPLSGLFKIMDSNQSFELQNSFWNVFLNKSITVNFTIKTWVRGSQYFKNELPIKLSISTFDNLTYKFSSILTNEIYLGYVYVYNYFDIPVKYTFHNILINNTQMNSPDFSVQYDREMTIGSHETREVRLFFEATKEGVYNFTIPVSSNVTKPFFIHITANAIYPSIRFADENGLSIASVSFVGGDDYFYGSDPWTQCVYVQNTEPDFILLGEMNVSNPKFMKMYRDSDLIMPGESTLLCFSLISWLYDINVTELTFTMEVNSSKYILPITIRMCQPVNNRLTASMESIIILFSTATMMLPVAQLLINLCLWIAGRKTIHWKISHRKAAVKHFSVREKTDVGMQKEEARKIKVSHWVGKDKPGRARKFASEEAVQNLEMLLR